MKLRFRSNSLRLRVNQVEVRGLAAGNALEERIEFPGGTCIRYVLEPAPDQPARASFENGMIRISAPRAEVEQWAAGEAIGIYFELPANGTRLRVSIEKDLECIDTPPEERDQHAFPRTEGRTC